ncbi:transporter, partial [Pseudomonas syringae]
APDWLDGRDGERRDDAGRGGGSLGSMLAAGLAAGRGEGCGGFRTLARNACCVTQGAWRNAMPAQDFGAFLAGCADDPDLTLKRFSLLCTQGAEDPRGLARLLKAGAPHLSKTALIDGLKILRQLDTRSALQTYRGPQLHLFAGLDA